MYPQWFFVVFVGIFCLGCLGAPDSCYYCTGTPECGDPIDYNEVSPRKCIEDSVCLKYISSSKNEKGEMVAHELTYRQCFQAELFDEDVCTVVKASEEEELHQLNHTLVAFECYVCEATNCNSAQTHRNFHLTRISLFLILLNVLSFI